MGLNQVKVVETWLDLSDSHSLTAWGCRNGIRSIYGWTTAVLWCLAADALDATVKSLSCPRSAQVAYCHSAWLPRRLLLASKAVDVDAIEAEVAADATWWRYSLGNLALIGVLGAFRAALFQWQTPSDIKVVGSTKLPGWFTGFTLGANGA